MFFLHLIYNASQLLACKKLKKFTCRESAINLVSVVLDFCVIVSNRQSKEINNAWAFSKSS